MGYLESTVPSDYDLHAPWSCTIGKTEYEMGAWNLVEYLQANGDEWRPVPLSELPHAMWPCRYPRDSAGDASMPEGWLELLQRVRAPRPGPPWLIDGQLRWPNGKRLHGSFWEDAGPKVIAQYQRVDKASK